MPDFDALRKRLSPLFSGTGGIDSWLSDATLPLIREHLSNLDTQPLSHSEMDQFLILSGLEGVSQDFFRFYWTDFPALHPYDVTCCGEYNEAWKKSDEIISIDQFAFGWTRFYTDALLYFGDVQRGYEFLAGRTFDQLESFFHRFVSPESDMRRRGRRVVVTEIPKDQRFLIAEMACKTLEGDRPLVLEELERAYHDLHPKGGPVSMKELVGEVDRRRQAELATGVEQPTISSQAELTYALDGYLDFEVDDAKDIRATLEQRLQEFNSARSTALQNTRLYLSMVKELDVYVATSMRTREHFRDVANLCTNIFQADALTELNVRYFDPTMSAASGHEDKGLIECLMVRSARALVYSAGDRDSWGKDAEATMALSMGKPVIFFCDEATRKHIFDNIHPLSRLISFDRGVAVGAMVVSKQSLVSEILSRVFTNKMRYKLRKPSPGETTRHLRLEEDLSQSTVRIQSADEVLRNALRNAFIPAQADV